jgi:hypothetical protein
MRDGAGVGLRVVDGLELDAERRRVLRPGELLEDVDGRARRLPRYFYEVPSWDVALETPLAADFNVWEFLNVDVREHPLQRSEWPRYLPCAVSLLAGHLALLRASADTYVHVAANGGYRSPSHRLTTHASTHCWGTAANLYRVGDDWLQDEATIGRYVRRVRALAPAVYVRPYGTARGEAEDHLHLDLGYVTVVPRDAAAEADPPHTAAGETETVDAVEASR